MDLEDLDVPNWEAIDASAAHLQLMDEREAMDARANWDDLPSKLWPRIGKSLHHHIDLLRFRSVCKRSSRERVR